MTLNPSQKWQKLTQRHCGCEKHWEVRLHSTEMKVLKFVFCFLLPCTTLFSFILRQVLVTGWFPTPDLSLSAHRVLGPPSQATLPSKNLLLYYLNAVCILRMDLGAFLWGWNLIPRWRWNMAVNFLIKQLASKVLWTLKYFSYLMYKLFCAICGLLSVSAFR